MGLLNRHRLWYVVADAVLLVLAWYAAFFLRFDRPDAFWEDLRDSGVARVVAVKLLVLVGLRVYTRIWRYTSLRDVLALARACLIAEGAAVLLMWLVPPIALRGHTAMPKGIVAFDLILTGLLLVTARALPRILVERPRSGSPFARGTEVLVIGAGDAGNMILREMALSKRYTAIGILDDDRSKHGSRLHGVEVLGPIESIARVLDDSSPDEVVIAMHAAPGSRRQLVVDACRAAAVPVRTLPGPDELLGDAGDVVGRLREVRVEDVLGRPPVRLEIAEIGGYLADRVVLVTGAGGSIGSEIVRQVARVGVSRLVLVERSENSLFEIDRELTARGVVDVASLLVDVSDGPRMREVLETHRPSVVFHAAAYKHVPIVERNPAEAIRNNTLTTRDLAVLAGDAGVERFVLISTDKAVNPENVMGASKALCEWVIEAAAQGDSETRFIAVRFGNVLASSGSVIPIFREQIANGGPVTVTDNRMTRFFMTMSEAAQLVIDAGGVGESGDIFVLDMGEPISIRTLAEDMIRLSGAEIEIKEIGIRPGEKLSEALFERDEQVETTRHEKLRVARRAPIDAFWLSERLEVLEALVAVGDTDALVRAVHETVSSPVRATEERDRTGSRAR